MLTRYSPSTMRVGVGLWDLAEAGHQTPPPSLSTALSERATSKKARPRETVSFVMIAPRVPDVDRNLAQ